jgi:hypothetical protein
VPARKLLPFALLPLPASCSPPQTVFEGAAAFLPRHLRVFPLMTHPRVPSQRIRVFLVTKFAVDGSLTFSGTGWLGRPPEPGPPMPRTGPRWRSLRLAWFTSSQAVDFVCFHSGDRLWLSPSVDRCQVKRHRLCHQQRLRLDHPGHRLQTEVAPPDLPLVRDLEQDGPHQTCC